MNRPDEGTLQPQGRLGRGWRPARGTLIGFDDQDVAVGCLASPVGSPVRPVGGLCTCLPAGRGQSRSAARASGLSPRQILERLSRRLDLLQGGKDAEPRQQTLRATIGWSYALLDEEERRLFARLSVFGGGCTLEAAEVVAEATLDTLQSLVDKSLVRHAEERFWMLETVREYAVERLEESGEADHMRQRHAQHFLALAEEAAPNLRDLAGSDRR